MYLVTLFIWVSDCIKDIWHKNFPLVTEGRSAAMHDVAARWRWWRSLKKILTFWKKKKKKKKEKKKKKTEAAVEQQAAAAAAAAIATRLITSNDRTWTLASSSQLYRE